MFETALAYVKDPANRAILAFLGAGIAAVAAALWAIIRFFVAKPTTRADNGSVAIGGHNTGNVTIAPRPPTRK